MSLSDDIRLKIELQSSGARVPAGLPARMGGAGPADGVTMLIGGLTATVPTAGLYAAASPFSLEPRDGSSWLVRRDRATVREVELASEPRFYRSTTGGGVPFRKLALRHGRDAVGSTVQQGCMYGEDSCAFCAIGETGRSGQAKTTKSPGELAAVSEAAESEGYSHFILTTGTTDASTRGIPLMASCAEAIRERTGMKVHVQFEPPADLRLIEHVSQFSDSAAINIESFDEEVRRVMTPGKAAMGTAAYVEAWRRAVSCYGPGQVCCFMIVGLGETRASVLEGVRMLVSLGVYPLLLPLRPLCGTRLESWSPPSAKDITSVFESAAAIVAGSGLAASSCSAGCVRCGACSAFTDITG